MVLSFSPVSAAKPAVEKAAVAYLRARGFWMEASIKKTSPGGEVCYHVHDGVKGILVFLWVEVGGVALG